MIKKHTAKRHDPTEQAQLRLLSEHPEAIRHFEETGQLEGLKESATGGDLDAMFRLGIVVLRGNVEPVDEKGGRQLIAEVRRSSNSYSNELERELMALPAPEPQTSAEAVEPTRNAGSESIFLGANINLDSIAEGIIANALAKKVEASEKSIFIGSCLLPALQPLEDPDSLLWSLGIAHAICFELPRSPDACAHFKDLSWMAADLRNEIEAPLARLLKHENPEGRAQAAAFQKELREASAIDMHPQSASDKNVAY